MAHPRSDPGPTGPPAVCDCGYDLSGVAPGEDARCPECWRLVRHVRGPKTLLERRSVLAALMLAPGTVALVGLPLAGVLRLSGAMPVVLLIALILFLVCSVPACIAVAVGRTGRMDPILHGLLSVGIVPACAAANGLLGFLGMLIAA